MRLQDQRKKKGYSQSELSSASGVSLRMIQKYEIGERNIDNAKIETLCDLAIALDVKVYDEDRNEVELKESVDYTETDFRIEMEGDNKYDNRENLEGYQQKEFDAESGDLVDAEDDFEEDDDYSDDEFDGDDSYDDDFDE